MKRIILKRGVAWFAVMLMLLNAVVISGIGVSAVSENAGGHREEWVIYRPGTGTELSSNTGIVTFTDAGAVVPVTADGELNFYCAGMNLQIPDTLEKSDLALHMRIYIDDIAMMDVGQIELANQTNDDREIAWLLESVPFVSGWNDIVLPFSSITTVSGDEFDLHSPIGWFRLYTESKSAEAGNVIVENISITLTESGMTFGVSDSYVELSKVLPKAPATIEASIKMDVQATEWTISNCDGKDGLYNTYETAVLTPDRREDGTPFMRINIEKGGKASIRYKELGLVIPKAYDRADLAFSFQVYIDSIENLPSGELEITSDTNDSMEISWKVAKLDWHSGWNEVLLPFTSAHNESDNPFDCHFINYFRWTFSGVVPENMELGLAQMKIVSLKQTDGEEGDPEEDLWRISRCDGTDTLTDTSGAPVSFDKTDEGLSYIRVLPDQTSVNICKSNMYIAVPSAYEWADLGLAMKVYVSDPEQLSRWRLELASTAQNQNELQWNMNGYVWESGWNDVCLPLSTFDAQTGRFDASSINWFRFYSSFDLPKGVEVRVADIRIVPLKEIEVQGSKRECGPETHMIFSNTNSGDEAPYALLVTGDGHPSLIWGDRQVTFDYDVFTGEWIHLAVVRDMAQKAFILYVNGREEERADASGTRELYPTTRHCIGSDGAGIDGGIFGGMLGDIRVWSTVRSERQIAENLTDMTCSRSNGMGPDTIGLMGSWFLREDLDYVFNTVEDVSKENNTGIIRGSRADDWMEYERPAFCEEEGSYTIAVLPDIQELTAKYRDVWFNMAEWIRDNAESENIQHVIGMGDSTYNNNNVEWTAAREGYDLFAGKVTYTNILGNHDYGDWSKPFRDTTMYNQYFSYMDAVHNNDSFVGAYKEGEMDNAYYAFTVNGIRYLVLQLEYRPRDSVLDWADKVLDTYPNHNVIVAVHGYLNGKGQVMTDEIEGHQGEYIFTEADNGDPHNNGQELWDEVVSKHDNVRLVLCGHKHSENVVSRCDYTANGTPVYQMLFCAQDLDKTYFEGTGLGLIGLLRFSADGTKMALNYYAPAYDKSFRSVNQFEIELDVITGDYETEPVPVEPSIRCGHTTIDWSVETPATCTGEGTELRSCTACGKEFERRVIPAAGHRPGEWTTVKEATCTEMGVAIRVCTVCGEELDRLEVPPVLHQAGEWTVVKDATCLAEGERVKTCSLCGEVLERESIPKTEHTYGEWIVDKTPSILEEGSRHRVCSVCGDIEREMLPRLSPETGDVDGDGFITTTDARLILQHAVGKTTIGTAFLPAADVNGDGKIDTTDARLVLQMAAGKRQHT